MSEWISVKDRLPDYVQQVLVYRTECFVCEVMEYRNGSWNIWNGEYFDSFNSEFNDITHWMPLPEPPKGD
jgi:hypothetical protein